MAFTGKATFSAGAALPEIAEDVSDIIGIVSPHETPLLDHLGDGRIEAQSTVHEWLEDVLFPNEDAVNDTLFTPDATTTTLFTVDDGSKFRVGDQIKIEGSAEVMLVTGIAGNDLTVVRGYGATVAEALADNQKVLILGNAALEGDVKPANRFTNRVRQRNFTQIFTAGVEVSGSQQAVRSIGIQAELDYQKQERLREQLRDLENCVINGVSPSAQPEGSATTRRTMRGLIASMVTNRYQPSVGPIPAGGGMLNTVLNEAVLNGALRAIWEQSSARIDTIVVGGFQKRKINAFAAGRSFEPKDTTFQDLISVYESDFGVARVVLSRWVPADSMLLLDSSRIDVLPLAGRSFHFKPLASTGDSEVGQVIGEYTLQVMNENAHGLISGLSTTE